MSRKKTAANSLAPRVKKITFGWSSYEVLVWQNLPQSLPTRLSQTLNIILQFMAKVYLNFSQTNGELQQ